MSMKPIDQSVFRFVPCATCDTDCLCGDQERALRHITGGTWPHGPMTPEQRQWCIEEADRAAEGALKASELDLLPDADLARSVLFAWADYARSQGLL